MHEERGELQKAMAEYEAELVSNPKAYRASFNLAKALLDQGDLAGADTAAREGLRVKADPEIAPLGHLVLADVLNRRGLTREAQQEAAKARRLQQERREHRGT